MNELIDPELDVARIRDFLFVFAGAGTRRSDEQPLEHRHALGRRELGEQTIAKSLSDRTPVWLGHSVSISDRIGGSETSKIGFCRPWLG
jgi:hypothetical protein